MKPVTMFTHTEDGTLIEREKRYVDPDGAVRATFEVFHNVEPDPLVFVELNRNGCGQYDYRQGPPSYIRECILEHKTIRPDVADWLLGKINAMLMGLD